MNVLNFRQAKTEEAEVLTAIALAGKQYWGYPAAWMELWRHDLTITAHFIRTAPVQVAEKDSEVIGFTALSIAADGLYLEHLWLQRAYIGRGFGRALFVEAVRMAKAAGALSLLINSDPNAEAFYLKMGATRIGQEVYPLPGAIQREVPVLVYPIE